MGPALSIAVAAAVGAGFLVYSAVTLTTLRRTRRGGRGGPAGTIGAAVPVATDQPAAGCFAAPADEVAAVPLRTLLWLRDLPADEMPRPRTADRTRGSMHDPTSSQHSLGRWGYFALPFD